MEKFDFVIAGAGIIGLAVARELKIKSPALKIAILEKEPNLGVHASGRNSGVLHTGIYYPSDTLKAKFCKKGADALFQYAQENNISVRKDGKVVVARSAENAKGLEKLMANAQASGISAELMDEQQIKEIEPFAFAEFGGIYCKDTAVINSKEVLKVLEQELVQSGVEFKFNTSVVAADSVNSIVKTSQGELAYGHFINAAGSFSDGVAKHFGVGDDYKLIPFKGLYYKLKDQYAHKVNGSIYPVPDPALPFLGIHFTRVISGDVYVGPTAIPALGRENYGLFEGLSISESMSILMNLTKLYFENVQNFRNLVHKELPHLFDSGFIKSAASLVDGLDPSWIEKTPKVGIRPQLINLAKNKLEMDFLVEHGTRSTHVLNSISPAFTSSFSVAEHLVKEINI
ncbi:hypothetical protein JL49_20810 [Pseudoalteromonas luteoviolacea]|nr:hypothetical protein JL49_20810 [Pseudoalteromonas luteoviolacea]